MDQVRYAGPGAGSRLFSSVKGVFIFTRERYRNMEEEVRVRARNDPHLASEVEPVVGFEPTTDGLQNRCSTTELNWLATVHGLVQRPSLIGLRRGWSKQFRRANPVVVKPKALDINCVRSCSEAGQDFEKVRRTEENVCLPQKYARHIVRGGKHGTAGPFRSKNC